MCSGPFGRLRGAKSQGFSVGAVTRKMQMLSIILMGQAKEFWALGVKEMEERDSVRDLVPPVPFWVSI
jgi:hypothetical protein